MYRLLIVDDMPIIVDGLFEMFEEQEEWELELFRAYSVPQALEILDKTKIDIVLTDIMMPVKTGIDLLKEIRELWPRCKVIFLTGFNDFNYARETYSLGGFDYILKTEGDAKIRNSVSRAIHSLQTELEAELLSNREKHQYKLAVHSLQKQYLFEMAEGKWSVHALHEQFEQLEMPFDANAPIFLALARLEGWKQPYTPSDRMLLLDAAQNVMDEYFRDAFALRTIVFNRMQMLCIFQPLSRGQEGGTDGLSRAPLYINGMLESVQDSCKRLLHLEISFLLGADPLQWAVFSDQFHRLELLAEKSVGLTSGMLLTDTELQQMSADGLGEQEDPDEASFMFRPGQYGELANYLQNGLQPEFMFLFRELGSNTRKHVGSLATQLEIYHFLSSLFITHLNRMQLFSSIAGLMNLDRLYGFDPKRRMEDYWSFFEQLADTIFTCTSSDASERTNRIVREIEAYIQRKLSSDLSLTALGEHLHINPSYLSRLFKQLSGYNLSDYIAEVRLRKAKELLRSSMKIHEIAEAVGYLSGIAFARFFKKYTGLSPQEYRDKSL
ncbi:response regulator [Paenibacillus koleovorans]|uniref:response regulator n=1 Tax=Paenibacillus koleovorans TaxID=121608 RepID=UPI0013E2911F|nr:response regulator [Paenibacillus koleovorans]